MKNDPELFVKKYLRVPPPPPPSQVVLFRLSVCSVKFVGAFVFLFVGFWTALELWEILGDVTKSLVRTRTIKHYIAPCHVLVRTPQVHGFVATLHSLAISWKKILFLDLTLFYFFQIKNVNY